MMSDFRGVGGSIGHHKIGMSAYMGQNRIGGDGGSKNSKKSRTSFIYVPKHCQIECGKVQTRINPKCPEKIHPLMSTKFLPPLYIY